MNKLSFSQVALGVFLGCVGGIVSAVGVIAVLWHKAPDKGADIASKSIQNNYTDLLLTLITVSLAGIGIMIALVAAVIGWASLRMVDEAKDKIISSVQENVLDEVSKIVTPKAQEAALNEARNILKEMENDGRLTQIVERIMTKLMHPDTESLMEGLDSDAEDDKNGDN